MRVLAILLAVSSVAFAEPNVSATDIHPFAYDSKVPLDFHDNGAQDVSGVKVYDISYASPKGVSVPA